MARVLGLDVGKGTLKVAGIDRDTGKTLFQQRQIQTADEPPLHECAPAVWRAKVDGVLENEHYTLQAFDIIGVSLSAPIVKGQVTQKTESFFQGKPVEKVTEMLRNSFARKPVYVLNDGPANVLGEWVTRFPQGDGPRFVGMLAFGSSIGFGLLVAGKDPSILHSSWVSHMGLNPGFPSECGGCQQRGCWRALYQAFRDKENNEHELVEVMAQGVAALQNTLGFDRLYLGGGRIEQGGEAFFTKIVEEITPRLLVDGKDIPDIIQPAKSGPYAAAIGAAWHAATLTQQH